MRADARRNRWRILEAARDLFAERGRDVAFDAVGARAGVGNATLYRHFPSRSHLMRAVATDVLTRSAQEAEAARTGEPVPFDALARYMHRAIDARVAAVMPLVADEVGDDEGVRHARAVSASGQQRLVDAAIADGSLDPAITFADIGLILVRLSRPIPPFSQATNDDLSHRHLDIVLRGLGARDPDLRGRGWSLEELRTRAGQAEVRRDASPDQS